MKFVLATTSRAYWGRQADRFAAALVGLGHEARVFAQGEAPSGPTEPATDVLVCIGSGESPRHLLAIHPAETRVLYLLEPVPTLEESDAFTRAKLCVHWETLRTFDGVLTHTPRSRPLLEALGVPWTETLLWPYFPGFHPPMPELPRDIDVVFLGARSEHRSAVLDKIRLRVPVVASDDLFHGAATRLYARAKIVLNVHYTRLRNFECRVQEVLGAGAFLLTERLDPDDVYQDGVHLAVFDEADVVERVEHYLAHADERERIARAGHASVDRFRVEAQAARLVEAVERLRKRRSTSSPPSMPSRPPDPFGPALPSLPGARAIVDVGGRDVGWLRARYPAATVHAVDVADSPRPSAFLAQLGLPRIDVLHVGGDSGASRVLRDLGALLDRVGAVLLTYASEDERRELDALLGGFTLHAARAAPPRGGVLVYVARRLVG